jgi:pimeloyl-ACP methyl ester carboxylesterase
MTGGRLRIGVRIVDYLDIVGRQAASILRPRVPESYGHGDRAPVVLLPGVYEQWGILRPLADRLNAAGHPVHVVPGLGFNRRPIPDAAALAARRIEQLGLSGVVLVAHSKGGLVGKAVLLSTATSRISRLVAVATPFGGSRLADYMLGRTLREFRPGAPAIAALAADLDANARIVSIFGEFDPHIPEGSRLEGATNIELPVSGHFRVLAHPLVLEAVESAVDGAPRA